MGCVGVRACWGADSTPGEAPSLSACSTAFTPPRHQPPSPPTTPRPRPRCDRCGGSARRRPACFDQAGAIRPGPADGVAVDIPPKTREGSLVVWGSGAGGWGYMKLGREGRWWSRTSRNLRCIFFGPGSAPSITTHQGSSPARAGGGQSEQECGPRADACSTFRTFPVREERLYMTEEFSQLAVRTRPRICVSF